MLMRCILVMSIVVATASTALGAKQRYVPKWKKQVRVDALLISKPNELYINYIKIQIIGLRDSIVAQ